MKARKRSGMLARSGRRVAATAAAVRWVQRRRWAVIAAV
jgi:hypothetical protein